MSRLESKPSTTSRQPSPGFDLLLQKKLAEREALFWAKITAMVAFGLPLCLVGPIAVATLAWMMFCTGRRPAFEDVSWLTVFEISCFVMLPLMFLREWRAKRDLLEQAFADGELGHSTPNYIPYGSRSGGDGVYLYLAIFLMGPRMVVRALRQWHERQSLRHIDVAQAAIILATLVEARTGVEIESLHAPGLDRLQIRKIIIYLAFFEWIDLSSDLTRAWVETSALHSLGVEDNVKK